MSTLLLFSNPISGRGRARKLAERLERRLGSEGYDVRAFADPADQIPLDRLPEEAQAAIVIGGDGTLRAVAGRMLLAGKVPPPTLVVPMGTANLMGQHLGIQWTDATIEEQVLAALRHGRVVRLDTAMANDALLLLTAGVGIDGQIVHELAKRRSGPITKLSYLLPGLRTVGAYAYPPITVTVDGRRLFGPAPGIAFIGNVPEYGTGFPILPMASPTDGVIDVCALPCQSREDLAGIALRAAAGEHLFAEGAAYAKGKQILIESPVAVPVQVDGEAAGTTPLEIHLLEVRLAFIVP